ncbi:hypothetical protein OG21DRAFT_1526937 [Imleria badia]|nr:hypothetical protein OG21DRAFT_1526937 [Imleria badia]
MRERPAFYVTTRISEASTHSREDRRSTTTPDPTLNDYMTLGGMISSFFFQILPYSTPFMGVSAPVGPIGDQHVTVNDEWKMVQQKPCNQSRVIDGRRRELELLYEYPYPLHWSADTQLTKIAEDKGLESVTRKDIMVIIRIINRRVTPAEKASAVRKEMVSWEVGGLASWNSVLENIWPLERRRPVIEPRSTPNKAIFFGEGSVVMEKGNFLYLGSLSCEEELGELWGHYEMSQGNAIYWCVDSETVKFFKATDGPGKNR